VDALVAALKDTDWQVRKTAAWALGEIEDPRAIEDLRAAANDASAEVRRAVSQAIRELRDQRD
jgi:HEAT repeat protein